MVKMMVAMILFMAVVGGVAVPANARAVNSVDQFGLIKYSSVSIANSTWTMYNNTSGSTSTITFKSEDKPVPDESGYYNPATDFVRVLHGHMYKGTVVVSTPGGYSVDTDPFHHFRLCDNNVENCVELKPTTLSHDHMDFIDPHGGTIHLMRNNMNMG
jgi:hypothetical protein